MWLIVADAHHEDPKDRFLAEVRAEFSLNESVEQPWRQYRRRLPELASQSMCGLGGRVRVTRAHQPGLVGEDDELGAVAGS